MKGSGGDEHRPDKTKIVLDFVKTEDRPESGILQILEVVEGALKRGLAKEVSLEALRHGIVVLYVHLSGRKQVFLPTNIQDFQSIAASARGQGIKISPLCEL